MFKLGYTSYWKIYQTKAMLSNLIENVQSKTSNEKIEEKEKIKIIRLTFTD